MRITVIISLLIILVGCSNKQSKPMTNKVSLTAISAEFPLHLGEIDFNNKHKEIPLNDDISSKIDLIIKSFSDEIIWDERYPHTYMDAYINTICLQDESYMVYLVLLRYFPTTERVCGIALFYNNQKKEFIEDTFDLGLYSLYYYEDGDRLIPTNLKTELNITSPEIELTDFDMDGVNDYKFTTLIHNGTYNAIERIILSTKNATIDTLYFNERSLLVF